MPKDKKIKLEPMKTDETDLSFTNPPNDSKESDIDLSPIDAKDSDPQPIESIEPNAKFDIFGIDNIPNDDNKNVFNSIGDAITEYKDQASREKAADRDQKISERAMIASGLGAGESMSRGKSGRGKVSMRF